MKHRKDFRRLDQAGGGFPSIEARLVPVFLILGISIFITNYHLGFWKALLISVEWIGGIIGGFFALIFLLVGIGKIGQLFSPKRPKRPDDPNKNLP
jgi:hypothetical protein